MGQTTKLLLRWTRRRTSSDKESYILADLCDLSSFALALGNTVVFAEQRRGRKGVSRQADCSENSGASTDVSPTLDRLFMGSGAAVMAACRLTPDTAVSRKMI